LDLSESVLVTEKIGGDFQAGLAVSASSGSHTSFRDLNS
jgi:hypothetical protein